MIQTSFAQCERHSFMLRACVVFVALLAGACAQHSEPVASNTHAEHAASAAPQAKATPRVPDHFTSPDAAKPLPQTLDPRQFTTPSIIKAYELAREMPEVLAQQPCYCYCDAGFGHKSLLDCHIDRHSAECQVCLKEALLTGQMHKQGKSAAEIRDAINRNEWRDVKLD